jgi:hypothetical protein
MKGICIIATALVVLSCPSANANDSEAELATGGLILKRSDNIEMRSEELYISSKDIRVRYRFYNSSARPVTTIVAFPMPDITNEEPDANISFPTDDPENFLGFSTKIDGAAVRATIEQRVFARGIDRTEHLRRLGIPLAPHLFRTSEAFDRLSPALWDELISMGLAEKYDVPSRHEKHLTPRWTLKTSYYWEQIFPPRTEVMVDHRYKPSVGTSLMTGLDFPEHLEAERFTEYHSKYCTDSDFLRSVSHAKKLGKYFSEERISYILTTGGNWSKPIGNFRLVIDKAEPSSLVSFCGDGVRKVGPTQFEVRKSQFVPKSDLHVLILKPFQKSVE